MNKAITLITFLIAFALLGCNALGQTPLDPQNKGSLFASTTANYSCRAEGGDGCVGKPLGSKTGQACIYTILSLITVGDKALIEAMDQGGIKTVSSVGYSEMSIFKPGNFYPELGMLVNVSLFTRDCLIVRGE